MPYASLVAPAPSPALIARPPMLRFESVTSSATQSLTPLLYVRRTATATTFVDTAAQFCCF